MKMENSEFCIEARPHLVPLPLERMSTNTFSDFPFGVLANSAADYPVKRQGMLLLLGEKAGMRESVKLTHETGRSPAETERVTAGQSSFVKNQGQSKLVKVFAPLRQASNTNRSEGKPPQASASQVKERCQST
jgi:hypothetical protein